ncbi:hypothetical protein ACFE04_002034 [Oxalis oulophora]
MEFNNLSKLVAIFLFMFSGFPQSNLLHALKSEKYTHIRVYNHEVDYGTNQNAGEVTTRLNNSTSDFGIIVVMDTKLTTNVNWTSEEVGRAQGSEKGRRGRFGLRLPS